MQQDFEFENLSFLVGSIHSLMNITDVPVKEPFDEEVCAFLNHLSTKLMSFTDVRQYPDVVTLGFWLRKASISQLCRRFKTDHRIRYGRGVAFHVAPSNIPVNFAYSLMAGLLMGNANIVRVPSKEFPQVSIVVASIEEALSEYTSIKPYIHLIRYKRDSKINDYLSSICDIRIVWGGDNTIAEIRKSPLPPRSTEVTFADRYSLAVIDSDSYLKIEDKANIAENFYNDTYLSDQNACTSPRIVIWVGRAIAEAKEVFWQMLHEFAESRYKVQPIQAVNKLTSAYLVATSMQGVKKVSGEDNLIVRIQVPVASGELMNFKDNSGYFFEYDCQDIMDIRPLCNNKGCQTIGYIGDVQILQPLLRSGIKGVDRVVPIGRTMDFDLIWDGYNLFESLTRTVSVE